MHHWLRKLRADPPPDLLVVSANCFWATPNNRADMSRLMLDIPALCAASVPPGILRLQVVVNVNKRESII
jgi:hypothetical protein